VHDGCGCCDGAVCMAVQSPNNTTTAENMAVDCHALEQIDSANLADFSRSTETNQYGDSSTEQNCSTLCDSKTKI